VHGANRLGGNSLLETLVFGKRAGERAVALLGAGQETARHGALADALRQQHDSIQALKARRQGERQVVIRRQMQATMTEHVGVFREVHALRQAVQALAALKARYNHVILDNRGDDFNQDLVDTLELDGLLALAEATALSALRRTESRGSHWRVDYPARDDETWLKHSLATFKPEGAPDLEYGAVSITRYAPQERKY
jgi:succinate dehydrogenase / fumarate reductase flavoprotein subunit